MPILRYFKVCPSFALSKARIFLLVDLREFFFRVRVGGDEKKSSENDQLTGHFQSCFFFRHFFLISPEKTVKLVR